MAGKKASSGTSSAPRKSRGCNSNDGSTPLYWAAYNDCLNLVEALISAGADIDAMEGDGWTPLHLASFFGRRETAEALLERGADVNARSRSESFGRRNTPLHAAAANRQTKTAELLMERGYRTLAVADAETPDPVSRHEPPPPPRDLVLQRFVQSARRTPGVRDRVSRCRGDRARLRSYEPGSARTRNGVSAVTQRFVVTLHTLTRAR